jgi:4-hydroxy-3-polyprenylbenzoate decarboxylase
MKRKIVLAVTGASGSVYAQVLMEKLLQIQDQVDQVGLVFSSNARDVWEYELQNKDYENFPWKIWGKDDFFAPFASGSAGFDTMIICPCSMGTLGRISAGLSDDLITRSADVILKERRKLICVLRDTPYSLIHIKNMETVTLAGGIICPATPSFYSVPKTIEEYHQMLLDDKIKDNDFQVKEVTFYNINAITKDSDNPNETIIYCNGYTFYSPLSIEQIEEIIGKK